MLHKIHRNDEKRRELMEINSKCHKIQWDIVTDTFGMTISGLIFHDISHSDSVPESPEKMPKNPQEIRD